MIKVIDIFAGPGGLSEGFAAVTDARGRSVFEVMLSIEKDKQAHSTLLLRTLFRQFTGAAPDDYYRLLRGEIDQETLFKAHPAEAKVAAARSWHATLGPDGEAYSTVRRRIAKALGNDTSWVLIGGPPCQAYSSDDQRRQLRAGGTVRLGGTVDRSRHVHGTLSDGLTQLEASSAGGAALRVLWIRVIGPGDIHRSLTAFTTLYGVRWFHILDGPCVHGVNVIPCFLAGRSWFKSHERVCAAVMERPRRIGLRTSPFSPDRERLARSRLYSVLSACGAVFDLPALREPWTLYWPSPARGRRR